MLGPSPARQQSFVGRSRLRDRTRQYGAEGGNKGIETVEFTKNLHDRSCEADWRGDACSERAAADQGKNTPALLARLRSRDEDVRTHAEARLAGASCWRAGSVDRLRHERAPGVRSRRRNLRELPCDRGARGRVCPAHRSLRPQRLQNEQGEEARHDIHGDDRAECRHRTGGCGPE